MPTFTTRPEIRGTFGVVASTHWIASAVGMARIDTVRRVLWVGRMGVERGAQSVERDRYYRARHPATRT